MATSTTTKAKTKTSKKKPAAKSAAKVSSVKSKKTPSKAKVASKAKVTKISKPVKTVKMSSKRSDAKVTTSSRSAQFGVFKRGQVLLAGLYALIAVAAGFLMTTASAQVFLGHLAKDELASRAGTVLAPAAHVLYEVEFRWLLVALMVVSAVIAILRATKYRASEEAGLKTGVQPLRWVEFAVTGVIAFEIVALLNGLQDVAALKLAMASIVVAAVFAWNFERENAVTGKPSRTSYLAAAGLVAIPVLALLVTMYGTYVYGIERSPWYAYAAAAIVSLGLLTTVRSVWNNFKSGRSIDQTRVNRNFNRLAVGSKVALALVLIVGFYAK